MKLTAIVLAKNEERNISKILESLSFCNERIVVDNGSTDTTIQQAKQSNARVVDASGINDFSRLRNLGLENATGDWVLFIDADERVSKALQKEIVETLKNPTANGYYLKRSDVFLGRKLRYGETASVRLLRLAKRNAGKWLRPVHETWIISGERGELKNSILHAPHSSIFLFLKKINYYTELELLEYQNEAKLMTFTKMILYPKAKFISNYIIKLGFLDGFPGFVMACMMSFHSFCLRVKLLTK